VSQLYRRYSGVAAPILIAIIALLIYSNTFSSPFMFDDINSIVKYDSIKSLSNVHDLYGRRYIGELSFALNYYLGELNVFGYHLVNIIIHIINGLLVWWFVNLTFKTPVMSKSSVSPQLSRLVALTSAIIFAAHPIQTQAVTYIIQRHTSLAALFYLLSVVLFVKWRLSSGNRYRLFFYLVSLLSAVVAMKTKEISFTLPFVIILYEFIFFRGALKRVYSLIPYILTLVIIPLSIMDTVSPTSGIGEKLGAAVQETEIISRGDYLITQFRVIVTYIRLLFLPVNQNLDYDYPVYDSFFTPEVFLSFLFLLAVFGLGIYLYKRASYLVSFGIFWFFITLSVESSVIPIRDVIFEHRLYLPSAGAVIAFSCAVLYGFEHIKKRLGVVAGVSSTAVVWVLIFIIVVPLSYATYQRNGVWRDGVTLWGDVVTKSPLKSRGYNGIGLAYFEQGRVAEAIEAYRTALRLNPASDDEYFKVYHNLGLAYVKQGRITEAIEAYRTAIKHNPAYEEAFSNLGLAYMKQGRIDEAIGAYRDALRLKPTFAEAYINLGLAYFNQGRFDEAIGSYRDALRLNPNVAGVYINLGLAYLKQGRIDYAIGAYKDALRLNPTSTEVRNNLGLAYVSQGRINEAIEEFKTALRLKPDYAKARSNLELAYEIKGIKNR